MWNGTTSVTFLRSKVDVWRLFCGARCHLLRNTFSGGNWVGAQHLRRKRRDGLRIDVPIPLDITVRKNTSENNGQYGMWATAGTVTDGGNNVSNNAALGCFTIVCS